MRDIFLLVSLLLTNNYCCVLSLLAGFFCVLFYLLVSAKHGASCPSFPRAPFLLVHPTNSEVQQYKGAEELSKADPEIFALVKSEKKRQKHGIELIASEV